MGDAAGLGAGVAVAVGAEAGMAEGVGVGVSVGLGVLVGLAVGVNLGASVGSGVRTDVAVGSGAAACLSATSGVGDAVGLGAGLETSELPPSQPNGIRAASTRGARIHVLNSVDDARPLVTRHVFEPEKLTLMNACARGTEQ